MSLYKVAMAGKKYLTAITCALLGAALLTGCKPAVTQDARPSYFDIKGYFKNEAAKLAAHNKPVLKTIIHNGVTETRKVNVKDWQQELNMFIAADINKPAWRNSYTIKETANSLIYKTEDPALEVRDIIISKKNDGSVNWILIFTHTPKNLLYDTKEKLSWFPDSAYQIQKSQTVRLLGKNTYDISGKLNQ